MEKEQIFLPDDVNDVIDSIPSVKDKTKLMKIIDTVERKLKGYKKIKADVYPEILSETALSVWRMSKTNKFPEVLDPFLLLLISQDELYDKEDVPERLIARGSDETGFTNFEKGLFLEKIFLQMNDRYPCRGKEYVLWLIDKYGRFYQGFSLGMDRPRIGSLNSIITGFYASASDPERKEMQERLWDNNMDYVYKDTLKDKKLLVEFSVLPMPKDGIKPDPLDRMIADFEKQESSSDII